MDIATRFHPRARAGSYRDMEGNIMPEDSSGESESNIIRRKFQRTSTDDSTTSASSQTFRKPSLPASATRGTAAAGGSGGLEHRPSLSQRRSALRENMRVPSGPREYPSSPGKKRVGSVTSTTAPSMMDSTNIGNGGASRSFLPASNPESFYTNPRLATSASHSRFHSYGRDVYNNNSSTEDLMDSANTPGGNSTRPLGNSIDFLPDVNFDDFQTDIKNYDGTSPLLSDFPSVDGGRIIPRDDYTMPRTSAPAKEQQPQQKKEGLSRTQSLRQRLAGNRQSSAGQQTRGKDSAVASSQPATSTLQSRRQSSLPQGAGVSGPPPAATAAKAPRKSVGPGLLTNIVKGSSSQQQQSTASSLDATPKPALARNSSLNTARRTTMQPSASAGAELPRLSTLTATTQSRQNKVKSLQPAPRDTSDNPNTPSSVKASKNNQNRAHTPSSSGNKRQSMASGRASGLGARTISPTDARRLKRISMMQAPPMPTNISKAHTPTPQEEIPNPLRSYPPELPRMAQPSPSLIPRKTSSATPSSARASPEGRLGYSAYSSGGGVSLSTKSSYQSLISASGVNGSTSRLPTPKPRNGSVQSGSSMGQYGESYGESEQEEFVPPVPAIPKAYESPRDLEHPPFFSSSFKSSQSAFSEMAELDGSSSLPPAPRFLPTPRTSLDVPSDTPRKRSIEQMRPVHKRTNTLTNGANAASTAGPPKVAGRVQLDHNGRKNVNLQPLRLPPLNLMPFNSRTTTQNPASTVATNALPHPSEELDVRDEVANFATPEPRRTTNKTPSTPMTASKTTFFSSSRRPFEEQNYKGLRTSSSHYALRDVLGMDEHGNLTTKFWDGDSDGESGVPIPGMRRESQQQLHQQYQQQRSTITPFASGSLPKGSGEFGRGGLRGKPSGEYMGGGKEDEYSLGGYENMVLQNSRPRVRAQTNTTVGSAKSGLSVDTVNLSGVEEAPALATPETKKEGEKKEGSSGGLRRKLSLGWRRSTSKAANHAENSKNSPKEQDEDKPVRSRLQKKAAGSNGSANEMPPPKLPASATWTGDVPSVPSSARPSLDAGGPSRRKSQVPNSMSNVSLPDGVEQQHQAQQQQAINGVKTRSLHSEQPTPITSRASSWGNLGNTLRPGAKPAPPGSRQHKPSGSSNVVSAITKDKDDFAADDEMHRLSRKRKDVDSAARETEELKKRALACSPVSAEHILHDRNLSGGSVLNVFERGEIVDYENEGIYFTGSKSARKIVGSLTPSPRPSETSDGKSSSAAGGSNNFGYDDERGDYNIVLGDHLAYRYEVVDVLGKGSFGQVVRCIDHKDGGVVAVKIIRNKKRFHQQALVEVGILGRLREWDPDGAYATLSITSSFYFRSHLCIVTPCLSINLYEFIRAHNFAGFNLPLIRRFARQLLACLTLLQGKRIIHCDLKPENILLCEARKADVRVIDFGSSCREDEKVYTYIQSRFYRSPEVILGSSYGLGIDMWSLGCILAELWTGYPLFPGENEQEQLACIMEIFGPPDRHLVERCTRKKLFFDSVGKPRVTVSSKGRRRRPSSKTLQQALKTEDEAFVDFIARCLRWDPERRLKPSDAAGHPFVANLPMNQRQGIPDEARRAARLRSTAAVPAAATNGQQQNVPASPGKRGTVSNAFGQNQANVTATPTAARERSRQLPETPQTALRNGAPAAPSQGSPSKGSTRRHSTVATAGAAAMAGSKRASNGAVLLGGATPGTTGASAQRGASGNLAQMAARESMGAAGVQNTTSSGRWRT